MKNFFGYIISQVQRRIFLLFLFAACTVILFIRLIGAYNTDTGNKEFLVAHTYEVIKHMENARFFAAESDVAEKGYFLTGTDEWKQSLKQSQAKMIKSLNETISLVRDSRQKANLRKLENAIHQKLVLQNSHSNTAAPRIRQQQLKELDAREKTLSDSIRSFFAIFMHRQDELLVERSRASSSSKTKALTTAVIGLGLFFVFVTGTLIRLNRDIRKRKIAEYKIRKSETKYRRLIEDVGVTVFTSNLAGIFTYVSGRCQALTGHSSEELTGKSFATLIAPEWIDRVAKLYQQQFADGVGESTIEFPIITKSGEQKWVEQQAVLSYDNQQNCTGFQCVVKDITAKKEADLLLKKSEQLMQSVLNNTREGFFLVNRNYELLLINKQAREGMQRISGKTAEAGMNLLDFVAPDEKAKAIENLDRGFNGELVIHEGKYNIPEGEQWIQISHSPVRDDNGVIIGVAIVTHDITEKRKQEEKIRSSEQKIRAMLESSKEGFFMIGQDYSITMMNEVGSSSITAMTGKQRKIGDNILEYILPGEKELFKETFKKVMAGGHHETEMSAMTEEGQKWFESSYFPVRDDKNEIIGICASSKDVTEKKLVDNALAKIRAEREEYQFRLQSILDNTPLIVFVKDLEGRYLFVNKSFLELLHLSDKDVIGKTDFDITTPELAAEYKQVDDEIIQKLTSIEREETVFNQNGGQNLLLMKFPLFDRKKNIYGIGGIATDYTEKVEYRQKLIEAKKKAEQAEQLQEQFLANMSHEIRTPMNGIIGMTNVLLGTKLDEDQREFASIIKQSSDNLLFLINDILDLSKIKSGKLSLEKIQFNLHDTLETILAPFYIKAKEKNIELLLTEDVAIPQQLKGDPYRLNQILNNLLSNALKFTTSGTVKLATQKYAHTDSEVSIEFSVTDSGVGIAQDKLESIFNSFEQASSSTARTYGGTGLGLTITRQLIELQGGTINVSSVPGEGSSFRFTISYPFKLQKNKIAVLEKSKSDNNGLRRKKILVAEDNEINQKVIQNILKKEGVDTVITPNGREAVTRLEQGDHFDLIILDLRMPEMDGFQTATYIRKKLLLDIPIIAMTASALRNEKAKCFELGMNEYLTKPFAPEELFGHLRRFLLGAAVVEPEQVVISARPENELYNLSHVYEMEDHDYFCEILQLFLETTPLALTEIKEAILYENWDEVYTKAHKLKSGLGILQMNKLLDLVTSIEQLAKEPDGTDAINELLKQATELFTLIRPMIEGELNSERIIYRSR